MEFRLRQVAACLAAGATTFAFAAPVPALPELAATEVRQLSDQPLASVATGAKGPNVEVANAIVQALGADAELKGSKFTVAPEENVVLITGVTPTLLQMNRAVQIAEQHAGVGKVSNAIVTEQVWHEPAGIGTSARIDSTTEIAAVEAGTAEAETAPADAAAGTQAPQGSGAPAA